MMKHFGHKGLVLGAVLGAALGALGWAAGAQAAGYEVRLPVEKTVRLSPVGEMPAPDAAPAAAPDAAPAAPKDAKKPAPAAPKPEAAKAETSKPEISTPEAPKPVAPKAKAPAPAAAKPAPKPEPAPKVEQKPAAKPAPKPEPAPKPTPKPVVKPVPKVDPLALVMPPVPVPHAPMALPEAGHFVGDVEVEFQSDRVILRIATNGQAEQVTSFNVRQPRKLAVDLHGQWGKKGPPVVRFATGPVKNVVVGEHPDRLRLSLEFREGAVEPDMQPKVETGPKAVTVTIPLALHLKR